MFVSDLMSAILSDYNAMHELVGSLDFEVFCEGYLTYGEWRAAENQKRSAGAFDVLRRELRASASHAA